MFDFQKITIDMDRLCAGLSEKVGHEVTDIQATLWLRDQGLMQIGDYCLADSEGLRSLEEVEHLANQRLTEEPRRPLCVVWQEHAGRTGVA